MRRRRRGGKAGRNAEDCWRGTKARAASNVGHTTHNADASGAATNGNTHNKVTLILKQYSLVVFGLIESIGDDCSSDPLDKDHDARRET